MQIILGAFMARIPERNAVRAGALSTDGADAIVLVHLLEQQVKPYRVYEFRNNAMLPANSGDYESYDVALDVLRELTGDLK